MLSNLEQAHKYNGDAKKAYQAQDYRFILNFSKGFPKME
jgi:hypothetical protein